MGVTQHPLQSHMMIALQCHHLFLAMENSAQLPKGLIGGQEQAKPFLAPCRLRKDHASHAQP